MIPPGTNTGKLSSLSALSGYRCLHMPLLASVCCSVRWPVRRNPGGCRLRGVRCHACAMSHPDFFFFFILIIIPPCDDYSVFGCWPVYSFSLFLFLTRVIQLVGAWSHTGGRAAVHLCVRFCVSRPPPSSINRRVSNTCAPMLLLLLLLLL